MPAARGARHSRFSLRAIDGLGVRRLTSDSRRIKAGDTFVAYPGRPATAANLSTQAIARGAASVLWDDSGGFAWNPAWRAANLGVPNLRRRAGVSRERCLRQAEREVVDDRHNRHQRQDLVQPVDRAVPDPPRPQMRGDRNAGLRFSGSA